MSTVIEALATAGANHGYVAARPTGLVIQPARLGAIRKWGPRKWTPWQPNLFDLAADDWQAAPLDHTLSVLNLIEQGE